MKFSFGKGIKTWKTEFKLNMTDLGEVLDAFSGCKNIQTTEASNELQAQPPAPQAPGVGKGNSLILSTMGKRSKTTQHWGHTSHRSGAWLGPARQSSQEGHCATVPTTGSPWCHCSFWIWNRNTTEFLTFYPKDNWRYKLRYSWGEKKCKTGPEPTPVGICSLCAPELELTDNDHHQTPEQELFWQEVTAKIFYHLRFSSVEIPLVWVPIFCVITSLCENLTSLLTQ